MKLPRKSKYTKEELAATDRLARSRRTKARDRAKERAAICYHHFHTLLSSPSEGLRHKGIAFFQEVEFLKDPYLELGLAHPENFCRHELYQPLPAYWHFDRKDLRKCHF